jgi:ferredoxin
MAAVESILENLFKKGFIMSDFKGGEKEYDLNISDIDYMVVGMSWSPFEKEVLDLYAQMTDEEISHELDEEGRGSRVIPIERTVEQEKEILPYEKVSQILDESKTIAVIPCVCRTKFHNCENPVEVCITRDDMAEYMLERGVGRQIDTEEAISILNECEDLGLIHEVSNSSKGFTWLCNCCTCCCFFLKAQTKLGKKHAVAKSRYLSVIGSEHCDGCELCIDRCKFDAIQIQSSIAIVDEVQCFGCGLCASICPNDAIELVPVRTPDHIPEGVQQHDSFYL